MNRTRPLFLTCVFLLSCLFAVNLYADEVSIKYEGGTYTGEVSKGVPEGQGVWIRSDGYRYVGKWESGLPNGEGISTFPDGSRYVGKFRDGLVNGQGSATFPGGIKLSLIHI